MTYTPKTWANGQTVDATDTNRWEQGIDANDALLVDKANTVDVPSALADLSGTLTVPQMMVDGVKMVVFNTTTSSWAANPAEGRTDIHILFVGGVTANPPPAVAGRDLWFRPVP